IQVYYCSYLAARPLSAIEFFSGVLPNTESGRPYIKDCSLETLNYPAIFSGKRSDMLCHFVRGKLFRDMVFVIKVSSRHYYSEVLPAQSRPMKNIYKGLRGSLVASVMECQPRGSNHDQGINLDRDFCSTCDP